MEATGQMAAAPSVALATRLMTRSFQPAYQHTFTVNCYFSSTSSDTDFFTYNSGRARRRRKRQEQKKLFLQQKLLRKEAAKESIDETDTRRIIDIVFPNPYRYDKKEEKDKMKWPKDLKTVWLIISDAVTQYRLTWEGFFSSRGLLVETPEESSTNGLTASALQRDAESKKNEIVRNAKKNALFVQDEALELRKEVRERTGINSSEDLKRYAAEAMQLMSTSLKEFMAGYRKGRDDEVEKMLTEYFQDLKKKFSKPRRRKRKRRVLKR